MALAISSASPMRPRGTRAVSCAFVASSAKLSRPGVGDRPRAHHIDANMRRPFSSAVQVRAKERIAALVAP